MQDAFPGDWKADKRWFERAVGGSWSEGDWRLDYAGAGLALERPPIREVEVGIQRVYRLFKLGKLKIHESLEWLIRMIEDYSRELDDEGEPKEAIEDKEKFHGCDALRYIVAALRPTDEWEPKAIDTIKGANDKPKLEPVEEDKARFERNKAILKEEQEKREDREEEGGASSMPEIY